MELGPGRRIGARRVGSALPAPPGFLAFAFEDDDDTEVILPNAHLRLRAGSREAWMAGREARRAAGAAALPEVDWVEVDGWPAWVRPRVRGPLVLQPLDDAARASLAGWLLAAGVDLRLASAGDLLVDGAGLIRFAPLGLAEGQLRTATLAEILGEPGPAPSQPPTAPERTQLAPAPSGPIASPVSRAPTPPALVIVQLPSGNTPLLARVAARTGTGLRDIERAAERPGRWIWAPVSEPARGGRLRAQAERAGLRAEVVATSALSPTFLPALVAGGVAQVPLFVHSGLPALDIAIITGLGITAVVSMVRQGRRIAPARRAAGAIGAWEGWGRAARTTGPEARFLALEQRITLDLDPEPVRRDLGDALDHAWTHLFAALEQEDPQRARSFRRMDEAAKRVATALASPEAATTVQAIAALRAAR